MVQTLPYNVDSAIDRLDDLRSEEAGWLAEEFQLESLVHDACVHGTIEDQRMLRHQLHSLRLAREAQVRYAATELRKELEL